MNPNLSQEQLMELINVLKARGMSGTEVNNMLLSYTGSDLNKLADKYLNVKAPGISSPYSTAMNSYSSTIPDTASLTSWAASNPQAGKSAVEYATSGAASPAGKAAAKKGGFFSSLNPAAAGRSTGKFMKNMGDPIQGIKDGYAKFNDAYMKETGRAAWTKAGGIDGIGKLANAGGGLYHAANALNNATAASNANQDYNDLVNDIKSSAFANPMYASDLDSSQRKLIRQVKSGTYQRNGLGSAMNGVVQNLPKTALNAALGLASGGVPGALIQGLGTAVNSGIKGYKTGIEQDTSKFQGLYEQLLNSEQEYRKMRRPSGMVGSGLQSRYFNQMW